MRRSKFYQKKGIKLGNMIYYKNESHKMSQNVQE